MRTRHLSYNRDLGDAVDTNFGHGELDRIRLRLKRNLPHSRVYINQTNLGHAAALNRNPHTNIPPHLRLKFRLRAARLEIAFLKSRLHRNWAVVVHQMNRERLPVFPVAAPQVDAQGFVTRPRQRR